MKSVKKMMSIGAVAVFLLVLYGCRSASLHEKALPADSDVECSAESVVFIEDEPDTAEYEETVLPESASMEIYSQPADPWYCISRLIYHACGGVDGVSYTNSREAMESTLANDNMLVEVDFLFTTDGHLICGHKWNDIIPVEDKKNKKKGETIPEIKCTLDEFLDTKIKGSYTGLTGADIISYMQANPLLYIVVDTKEDDSVQVVSELLRLCDYQPEIADRFVIQLYDCGLKAQMLDLYPFSNENFLFTCYKFDPLRVAEILEICDDEQIFVVTVPYGSWEAEIIDQFLEQGIILFEHTVNLVENMDLSLQKGIYGFYTDFIQENELNMLYY